MEEQTKTKKKKNLLKTSEDLRVDRRVVTRISMLNINNPGIVEINTSFFAVPNEDRETEEYEWKVGRIVSYMKRELRKYVSNNSGMFDSKHIIDINFTSANLRKGYNKSVQVSLFVRQNPVKKFTKIKNEIKETIKPVIKSIADRITEEDFKCYKKKQKTNSKNN